IRNQERSQAFLGETLRPGLLDALKENGEALDAACQAALAGPIRFETPTNQGTGVLVRHLALLRSLVQTLGVRALIEVREGRQQAAWTNLLASSRLVTAWETEPVELSHLVRCTCAAISFDLTWHALQAGGWSDDQLARLQR